MAKNPKSQTKQKKIEIKRGDVFLTNFDPTIGHEIKKTRPALVIQNNIGNHYSPITIVAAITSQFNGPAYPTEVIIESRDSGLPNRSAVVLNQIRSIDKQRLIKPLGHLNKELMRSVDEAIEISLGLIEL